MMQVPLPQQRESSGMVVLGCLACHVALLAEDCRGALGACGGFVAELAGGGWASERGPWDECGGAGQGRSLKGRMWWLFWAGRSLDLCSATGYCQPFGVVQLMHLSICCRCLWLRYEIDYSPGRQRNLERVSANCFMALSWRSQSNLQISSGEINFRDLVS